VESTLVKIVTVSRGLFFRATRHSREGGSLLPITGATIRPTDKRANRTFPASSVTALRLPFRRIARELARLLEEIHHACKEQNAAAA
jgi:hypothetical protein